MEDGLLNWVLCDLRLCPNHAQTAHRDPYGTSRNRNERIWKLRREIDLVHEKEEIKEEAGKSPDGEIGRRSGLKIQVIPM